MKNTIARVEDSLHETRSADEDGIVAGGGVALVRCLPAIEALHLKDDDEKIGVDIVMRAIEFPVRALAANAGVGGSLVVQEVKKRKSNKGYNLTPPEYQDLVKPA